MQKKSQFLGDTLFAELLKHKEFRASAQWFALQTVDDQRALPLDPASF
jgi:hypothetical protein